MVQQIHLLVLIHGMWGNPANLAALNCAIKNKHAEPNGDGEGLDVLLTQNNRNKATYDGIDWGGERTADEVHAETPYQSPFALTWTYHSARFVIE